MVFTDGLCRKSFSGFSVCSRFCQLTIKPVQCLGINILDFRLAYRRVVNAIKQFVVSLIGFRSQSVFAVGFHPKIGCLFKSRVTVYTVLFFEVSFKFLELFIKQNIQLILCKAFRRPEGSVTHNRLAVKVFAVISAQFIITFSLFIIRHYLNSSRRISCCHDYAYNNIFLYNYQ